MIVAGLLVLFLLGCAWWLSADGRVPDFDTAKHTGWALDIRDALTRGDLLYPFNRFNTYPPLVHLVGGLGMLIGGVHLSSAVLAADFVFIPVLAVSLYGAGSLIGGRLAGVLAVLFALGAPMLLAQAHVFMLELPETALVAAALWGLLASERLTRPVPALLAGVTCGLGLIDKPTFVFFVAGPLLVVLIRGGWRSRRGLALFLIAAAAIGAPWYVRHFGQLGRTLAYATPAPNPPRFSLSNAMWFTWDQINGQLLVPLYLFTLVGVLWAIRRWRRGSPGFMPELLIGALVAYLGLTYGMSLHAPYYSLPALPYEAWLGTVWIPAVGGGRRTAAIAALAVFTVVNTISVGTWSLGRVSLRIPGQQPLGFTQPRRLTFVRSYSWPVGPPAADGRLLDVFRRLRSQGFSTLAIDSRADRIDFDLTGLLLWARITGLRGEPASSPAGLKRQSAYITLSGPQAPWPACRHLSDGTGVLILGARPGGPHNLADVCPRGA